MNKKYVKDFAFLGGVIIFCAIAARMLGGHETLEEYAEKNPSAAYASSSEVADKDSSTQDSSIVVAEAQAEASSDAGSTSSYASTGDSKMDKETKEHEESPERVIYMEDFYYEPISNDVFKRISGISYPVDCTVSLDELRYVGLRYVDFNGDTQSGEMICNKSIAQDVVEIFYELYSSGYQLESVRLVDEFDGDDTASMLANNTSCFNYRMVEGTTRLSNHAKGLAIDINPFYNPYITYNKDGTVNISPAGSEPYADRSASFPYKIDENDLAYKLFTAHGFKWGGNWNSVKDYQHFERSN